MVQVILNISIVGGDSNYIGNSCRIFIYWWLNQRINPYLWLSNSCCRWMKIIKLNQLQLIQRMLLYLLVAAKQIISLVHTHLNRQLFQGSTNIINNSLDSAIVSGTYGYISNMGYSIIGAGSNNYVQSSSLNKYYSSIFSGYSNKIWFWILFYWWRY